MVTSVSVYESCAIFMKKYFSFFVLGFHSLLLACDEVSRHRLKASFFLLGFSISAAGPFFLLVICGGIWIVSRSSVPGQSLYLPLEILVPAQFCLCLWAAGIPFSYTLMLIE
jgi:hypothetical protein